MSNRNLFDLLNDVSDYIDGSEDKRSLVLLLLGFSLGAAVRAGWTVKELAPMFAWAGEGKPKPVVKRANDEQVACDVYKCGEVGFYDPSYVPSDGDPEGRECPNGWGIVTLSDVNGELQTHYLCKEHQKFVWALLNGR